MKTIRHRRLMRLLMEQFNGNYASVAIWLQGSKTYGDGTYNFKQVIKCKVCGK